MKQNINLYHPIFRKEAKRFSAHAMLQAAALVVVGAMAVYAFNSYQLNDLRVQAREADRAQAAAMKRLADVTQKFAGRAQADRTALEIARLEQEIAAHTRLEAFAQMAVFANTRGYADFFLAFARQSVSGVWLTQVRLSHRDDMVLQGRSISPNLIPQYIQKLANEPVLAGLEFKTFEVTRPADKEGRGHVDFRAGNIAAKGAQP